MERRNKKTKSVGNGEGSLYHSDTLKLWIFQYVANGKRCTIKQRKRESVKEFKARVTKLKNELDTGTYIGKSSETVISLAKQYIETKHANGTTSDRSYKREDETLKQIEKTCTNFCYKPIQNVTIRDIEKAKENMKVYSNNTISKIWKLLGKSFSIGYSPSRKILKFNIMQDEELKKPISNKKTEKVKSLTKEEYNKLIHILDNEERNHPYRNIVKMQAISGMRIGEVLARSINDLNPETLEFNVYNTLTQDENYNTIWSEHTKTYNKQTQVDLGQRYLPLDMPIFSELLEIIEEQRKKKITNIRQLLFWDYEKNTFITVNEINSWLYRLNSKYHISKKKFSSHRLRHTAMTYWTEIGLPLKVVQYLAGHVEDSKITDVYVDITKEFVRKALSNVG